MSIQLERLKRNFGSIEVIKGIDLAVEKGELFGFLGPNGAGKSTTMQMLCTLLRPSSGKGWVNGCSIVREPLSVRQSIGVIFQESTLDVCLTAEENLIYHGMLYHMGRKQRHRRIDEVLRLVGLLDRQKELTKTFSGGMRRRLEVARALLHEPKTLFLDEPTVGLDPQTRRSLWEYLVYLRSQVGLTLFVTTHYLDEAEYCDRVAILDHGQIIALGSPAELKRLIAHDTVSITALEPEPALEALSLHFHTARRLGNSITIAGENGQKIAATAIQYLAQLELEVSNVTVKTPSLEDVFIQLTGRTIRDDLIAAEKERKRLVRKKSFFWLPFRFGERSNS